MTCSWSSGTPSTHFLSTSQRFLKRSSLKIAESPLPAGSTLQWNHSSIAICVVEYEWTTEACMSTRWAARTGGEDRQWREGSDVIPTRIIRIAHSTASLGMHGFPIHSYSLPRTTARVRAVESEKMNKGLLYSVACLDCEQQRQIRTRNTHSQIWETHNIINFLRQKPQLYITNTSVC